MTMETCRPTFKLLLVVWGLFVFVQTSSAQRNAEEIIDIDGNVIPVHNVSGCYADYVTLTCTGSGIAPVRHIFTFRPPDVQENFNCLLCTDTQSDCYHNCCMRNSSVDCRSEQQPTKDLKQRLDDCSHKSQCTQVVGRTSLSNSQECPNFLQSHGVSVYSQNEDIEYMCIYQTWEMDVTQGETKTGAALFLKSRDSFYRENKFGFNLSCIITSDEDTTIVIKSLDLRMCRSPCEQHLYFIEADMKREVTLNETNSLGLGLLYQSTTNNLKLRLDSIPSGNLSLWLYVKPSNGEITVACERPLYFTTTTTTSTTTVETTASTTQVTTSHGHHDITCTESRMEFSIPLSSPHTSETATLSDPNCQINLTRTHVRGGVDLNSCGTTVQFQNDSVIFRNAIIFSAPASSSLGSNGSDDSVSQYQDIIPIECVYNRIATVHLSYMPVVRRVLFTESGVGQFSFNIQQFWDASFTSVVSDRAYPLRLEQDADIFIQLSVGSEGQPVAGHKEIGMEVQQCLVSPSSSVIEAQLHYYPLIQDGCPASSDVHIIPNTNASDSTVMRFRFRAVNFFDPSSSSSSSLVFVHCRMGLCLTGSCKPSAWTCLTPPARRVRRDVDQSRRAAHQLSTGPFLIMADEASASSSSTTATVMAVVSTSVATVAIVVAAIALIALRRRRTTARN